MSTAPAEPGNRTGDADETTTSTTTVKGGGRTDVDLTSSQSSLFVYIAGSAGAVGVVLLVWGISLYFGHVEKNKDDKKNEESEEVEDGTAAAQPEDEPVMALNTILPEEDAVNDETQKRDVDLIDAKTINIGDEDEVEGRTTNKDDATKSPKRRSKAVRRSALGANSRTIEVTLVMSHFIKQ